MGWTGTYPLVGFARLAYTEILFSIILPLDPIAVFSIPMYSVTALLGLIGFFAELVTAILFDKASWSESPPVTAAVGLSRVCSFCG